MRKSRSIFVKESIPFAEFSAIFIFVFSGLSCTPSKGTRFLLVQFCAVSNFSLCSLTHTECVCIVYYCLYSLFLQSGDCCFVVVKHR